MKFDSLNMNLSSIRYYILFLILIIIQVLICNQICLFGVAVPFIYIYLVISLPINMSDNLALTIAFLSGFLVDIFADTLGLNALSCTVLALIRKPVFYAYVPKEDKYKEIEPSISTLGWENYMKYLFTLTVIFCFFIFLVEFLSIGAIKTILALTVFSTILSFILMLGIDSLTNIKKENW